MMGIERLKEIITSLTDGSEKTDIEKMDLYNEILDGYSVDDKLIEYEEKLKEADSRYAELEQKYKDAFFTKLSEDRVEEIVEDEMKIETDEDSYTIEDALKIFED